MTMHFDADGLSFRYPEGWEMNREDTESGWTAHVQSPGTAFLLVHYDTDMPPAEDTLASTVEALRGEYPDLETEDRVDTLAGQPAVGLDMQFTSLDLTSTCWARSFYTQDATVLVYWQAADVDLDEAEPVLRAICSSLRVEE